MLTARQYELIGTMTIWFNTLESILDDFAPALLGTREVEMGKMIAGKETSFSRRTKLFESILKVLLGRYPELSIRIIAILDLLKMASDLSKARNGIVHGQIGISEDGTGRVVLLSSRSAVIDIDALDKINTEVDDLASELYNKLFYLRDALYTRRCGELSS